MRMLTYFAQDIKNAFTALPKPEASPALFEVVITQILIALGVLSVLMVVIGGVRYTFSQGEPDKINQAKNTIIYAIIGVVIAMFALVIVRFVTGKLT